MKEGETPCLLKKKKKKKYEPAMVALRQENHLNPGGRGSSELRSRRCTPAWGTEQDSISETNKPTKPVKVFNSMVSGSGLLTGYIQHPGGNVDGWGGIYFVASREGLRGSPASGDGLRKPLRPRSDIHFWPVATQEGESGSPQTPQPPTHPTPTPPTS